MRPFLPLAFFSVAGCAGGGHGGPDPVAKMFEVPYPTFLAAAGPQKASCQIDLKVSGEAGKKKEGYHTDLEVDPAGNVYVTRDAFETVRVGGSTWQRPDSQARWEKVESGARADQVRDDALVGWRPLLAPYRSRLHLKANGSRRLAGRRSAQLYDLSGDPGGAADGPKLLSGSGQVALDDETGFPGFIDFKGGWELPAPEGKAGRITVEVETLHCEVVSLGAGQLIVAPTGAVVATPTPLRTATPTPTPTPKKKKR